MAPEPAPAGPALTGGRLSVAVVIPTKQRPERLARLVAALLEQTAPIDELIVVDQSDTDAGRARVTRLVERAPAGRRPALHYVRDPSIAGAAAARNVGLDRARADIVVCVDDDMALEPDVLERLLAHHRRDPSLGALTPVITNYAPPARWRRLLTAVFCRGPFRDERQPVYWHWRRRREDGLVPVRMLGTGVLSLRRAALGDLRFDPRYRGPSLGEDLDLSWALAARGWRLAIATDARVVHDRGPRPPQRYEEAMLTSWAFAYHKHQPKTLANRLAFAWFVLGVGLGALGGTLRSRSLEPLRSFRRGLAIIRNGFRGSRFLAPPP